MKCAALTFVVCIGLNVAATSSANIGLVRVENDERRGTNPRRKALVGWFDSHLRDDKLA